MAQATAPMERGMPPFITGLAATLVVTAISIGSLGMTGVLGNLFGSVTDPIGGGQDVAQHWRAAEEWERQRHAMSPFIDPVIRSADQWEYQRLQQSPYIDWAARSAAQWEEQRRQQSSGF